MENYAIWLACERFQIRPPNVANSWDECNVEAQAELIAYSQIRDLEEQETANNNLKRLFG